MLKKLWRLILKLFGFKGKEDKVPQGVQIFNEEGKKIYDINSQAVRFCGVIDGGTVDTPVSGSVTVPSEFVQGNNEVFYMFPESVLSAWSDKYIRALGFSKIWIEGNTIHYSKLPTPVYYGVK